MTIPTEEPLTVEQAEAMLRRLSSHFHQPVMPIRRYCDKLREWAHCINDRARRAQQELLPKLYEWDAEKKEFTVDSKAQRAEYDAAELRRRRGLPSNGVREYALDGLIEKDIYAANVNHVFRNIEKSNLLARTLYSEEKIRETLCPEHKGVWSGVEWSTNRCPHGCQLTGWVPNEIDQKSSV